jgi:hypothetical protein
MNCVKGATSYEHLRTVDGKMHDTFKDACITMGLFVDDNEWDQALEEAGVCVATLAFGLRPRQGGCEVAGLEVDPGITSHAPRSAKSPKSVRE